MPNFGKQFETKFKDALTQVEGISVDRLYDPAGGYGGLKNICDFQVYSYPISFYFECKATKGNTLPFANITDNQYEGMLAKSEVKGIKAGIVVWWYEKDTTVFIDIKEVQRIKEQMGRKSINVKELPLIRHLNLTGVKRRSYFNYDGKVFIDELVKNTMEEISNAV